MAAAARVVRVPGLCGSERPPTARLPAPLTGRRLMQAPTTTWPALSGVPQWPHHSSRRRRCSPCRPSSGCAVRRSLFSVCTSTEFQQRCIAMSSFRCCEGTPTGSYFHRIITCNTCATFVMIALAQPSTAPQPRLFSRPHRCHYPTLLRVSNDTSLFEVHVCARVARRVSHG